MGERPTIDPSQLPSIRQLTMACGVAVLVGALLLVTTVLPAELGVDPTGVGRMLGLTQLGEMKNAPEPAVAGAEGDSTERTDTLSLTLEPDQGAEIKAMMRAGDTMKFLWEADNGPLFFEFHGDEKGQSADDFTSYEKATKQRSDGNFTAAFEGKHGWYWKNRTQQTITVKLTTTGVYESLSKQ